MISSIGALQPTQETIAISYAVRHKRIRVRYRLAVNRNAPKSQILQELAKIGCLELRLSAERDDAPLRFPIRQLLRLEQKPVVGEDRLHVGMVMRGIADDQGLPPVGLLLARESALLDRLWWSNGSGHLS